MLDGVTLDQIRTFIAAAEQGSFSAAGRKLRRAQSVVSHTLANLEAQLGVSLFERSGRYPQLTEEGQSLLRDARAVADHMDDFKARARSIREGLEPELSVAMDVMYPMPAITHAVGHCRQLFPRTPLRLYVEALGGVVQPVLDGSCRIGVIGSLPTVPDELVAEPLALLPFATVVAPAHPLAKSRKPLSNGELSKHVQLVLTDRTPLSSGRNFGVISPLTWRLADLGAKHAFLRAGFGWGHMPAHMVQEELDQGQLVEIRTHANARTRASLEMQAVYRKDAPPGPVGRAFIEALKH
ncbi:LysR family transcriptional regulator [Lysobacter sp. CCNWLW3]|uniref:LysR family transcriptional regulator n=1 Tax=unclassified Lysobacter TaxID=2635362 RepID=UPI002FD374D0